MSLLQVKNLRTSFPSAEGNVLAVNGVSLTLEEGETLGIVGESGSGKTVSMLSLLKLVPTPPAQVEAESALFMGRPLLELSSHELSALRGNQISMIFQDPMTSLNPFLKVSTQLTEVLETHRHLSRKAALSRSIEMLALVGIPSPEKRIHDYPHQFSGGMRQRVMIAMALLCEPKLLIADEPTTALDVTIQAQILDLIRKLRTELSTSVILITHNLGVVAELCNRVAVMYAGRIVEYGNTEDIFTHPQHPYTLGLLRSLPRLNRERSEKLFSIQGQPPDLHSLPHGCPFHPRCDNAIDRCHTVYPATSVLKGGHTIECWNPCP